VPEECE
jgi:hypothetical protein